MKKFMDEDFLLTSKTAEHLYHDYAKKMPILDYHCHLSPREIYEDQKYENLTQLWLSGDHYKWRAMRSNGVAEKYITGEAPDQEKFREYAGMLEKAIGNPLYHWSHLELKRYFGYEGVLSLGTADEVWNLSKRLLQDGSVSARKLIAQSGVEVICTTDDPVDSLEWHRKLREENFATKVLPSFRPDHALQIEKPAFTEYVEKLSRISAEEIFDFSSLIRALKKRLDFFMQNGCKVSDHGLPFILYEPYTQEEVDAIVREKLAGKILSEREIRKYKTAFMVVMGEAYAERDLVMQLHYGVIRDLNRKIFAKLGPDAGIDAIYNYSSSAEMAAYLNALAEKERLPKTIIYTLNPADFDMVGTVIGCFQDDTARGKIQHGCAWWFNDHKMGMRRQMRTLANLGLLGNFVGMLTDSRSFLSYTRHEYFRRILCQLIGEWVEQGEYPCEEDSLKKIIEGICYSNAKGYFGF